MNTDRVVLAYSGEEEYEGWDGDHTIKAQPGDDWVAVSPAKATQLLADFPDSWAVVDGEVDEDEVEARRAADAAYEGGGTGSVEPETEAVDRTDATDAAIALAEEAGIDLADVQGSGKDGRITQPDVEAAIAARDEAAAPEPVDYSEWKRPQLLERMAELGLDPPKQAAYKNEILVDAIVAREAELAK